MKENKLIKPVFKYIGGKTWLRDNLRKEITIILQSNPHIDTYSEPFSGGLGAFMSVYDLLIEHNIKNIHLNDINPTIIGFYKNLKVNKEYIIERLLHIEQGFLECIPEETYLLDKKKDKEKIKKLLIPANKYFKHIREIYNAIAESNVAKSATLLFLQFHCFNGVYRENLKGEYNTPFNWEAKEFRREFIENKIDNMIKVFESFDMNFTNLSFEQVDFCKNSLYYLDPPYINEGINENSYAKGGFNKDSQLQLIDKLKNVPFLYSNHDHPLLNEKFNTLFGLNNLEITAIKRKNIMAGKAENRGNDKSEILVRRK